MDPSVSVTRQEASTFHTFMFFRFAFVSFSPYVLPHLALCFHSQRSPPCPSTTRSISHLGRREWCAGADYPPCELPQSQSELRKTLLAAVPLLGAKSTSCSLGEVSVTAGPVAASEGQVPPRPCGRCPRGTGLPRSPRAWTRRRAASRRARAETKRLRGKPRPPACSPARAAAGARALPRLTRGKRPPSGASRPPGLPRSYSPGPLSPVRMRAAGQPFPPARRARAASRRPGSPAARAGARRVRGRRLPGAGREGGRRRRWRRGVGPPGWRCSGCWPRHCPTAPAARRRRGQRSRRAARALGSGLRSRAGPWCPG